MQPTKPIDPKYSLGIPEMDAQHACWIELIEQFRAAAADHLLDPRSFDAAYHALEQLLAYTKQHFASEEKFIAERGYPDVELHSRQHRQLEADVARLLDEIREHKTRTTPLKLNLLITIWLMEHIMGEDRDYANFLRATVQV